MTLKYLILRPGARKNFSVIESHTTWNLDTFLTSWPREQLINLIMVNTKKETNTREDNL